MRTALAIAALAGVLVLRMAVPIPTGTIGTVALSEPLTPYETPSLSFSYPARWHRDDDRGGQGSFYNPITSLSTESKFKPMCVSPAPGTTECGSVLDHLPPDGVLIAWGDAGMPSFTWPSNLPGSDVLVGGHPAKLDMMAKGQNFCTDVYGVGIERFSQPRDNFWTVTGCFTGPDVARGQNEFLAMLASVQFGADA